jgi:hypothetical protein
MTSGGGMILARSQDSMRLSAISLERHPDYVVLEGSSSSVKISRTPYQRPLTTAWPERRSASVG